MFLKKYLLFVILLIYKFSFCLNAQTAEQVISKYTEFTGGEAEWEKIKTMVTSGRYKYGGMEFSFISYSKVPDFYKYEVSLNGKSYIQSYNGKKGWKQDEFNKETKPTVLSGKSAVAMANEADVELESPFINYSKKGNKIILEGTDTIDSKVCFIIKLVKKNDEAETYFFNSQNSELVMKRAISKNVEMKDALIDIFYNDYRVISGVKIPFKSISKVDGQTVLTSTIEKVEINVPLKAGIFRL